MALELRRDGAVLTAPSESPAGKDTSASVSTLEADSVIDCEKASTKTSPLDGVTLLPVYDAAMMTGAAQPPLLLPPPLQLASANGSSAMR